MKKWYLICSFFSLIVISTIVKPITGHAVTLDELLENTRNAASEQGLYGSVMAAQYIQESGAHEVNGALQLSGLADKPNHNLFGIKGKYNGNSVNFPTLEDDGSGNMYSVNADFRVYPSWKESFKDNATVLKTQKGKNKRVASGELKGNDTELYSCTWKEYAKTYEDAAKCLEGTYATDSTYASKLVALIKSRDLTKYDSGGSTSSDDSDDKPSKDDKETSKLVGDDAWKNRMINFQNVVYNSAFKGIDTNSKGFISTALVVGLNNYSNKAIDLATIIMMYITTFAFFFMALSIIVYLVVIPNGLGGEKFARGFEKVTGVSSVRSNKNLTDLLSRLGIATVIIACLYANLIPVFISSVINIAQYLIALI